MSNMSYCRFQNTAMDLDDCQEALEACINDGEALSAEEHRAAKRLLETALNMLELVAQVTNNDLDDLDDREIEIAIDTIDTK